MRPISVRCLHEGNTGSACGGRQCGASSQRSLSLHLTGLLSEGAASGIHRASAASGSVATAGLVQLGRPIQSSLLHSARHPGSALPWRITWMKLLDVPSSISRTQQPADYAAARLATARQCHWAALIGYKLGHGRNTASDALLLQQLLIHTPHQAGRQCGVVLTAACCHAWRSMHKGAPEGRQPTATGTPGYYPHSANCPQ